jgi:hypothetical protein
MSAMSSRSKQGQFRVHKIPQRLLKITVAVVADAGNEAHHGGLAHLAGLGQFLGGHEHRFAWFGDDVLTEDSSFRRQAFDTCCNLFDQRVHPGLIHGFLHS